MMYREGKFKVPSLFCKEAIEGTFFLEEISRIKSSDLLINFIIPYKYSKDIIDSLLPFFNLYGQVVSCFHDDELLAFNITVKGELTSGS